MLYIFITTDVPFKFDLNKIVTALEGKMVLICFPSILSTSTQPLEDSFHNIIPNREFDLPNLTKLVQESCEKFNDFNPIILTADESVMMVTAQLRDYFGSPGYDAKIIQRFTNKIVMKERLRGCDIGLPAYVRFNGTEFQENPEQYAQNAVSLLGFPMFAKPINGSGSADTTKIANHEALLSWCNEHRLDDNFELDEFIEGTLYHCDSVIQNGKIVLSLACREITPCFNFASGKMLCSLIIPFADKDFEMITKFNHKVLEALVPPKNSVTHCEIFKTEDNELIFLEIAARAPGAKVPQLYEKCFGWNMQEIYFKMQMGLDINIGGNLSCYAANCMFPRSSGKVLTKNELPRLTSRYEIYWDVEIGQNITRSTDITTTSCSLVIWNANYAELCRDIEVLGGWLPVKMG